MSYSVFFFFFFFFQAEDGIRDLTVTGVQTCALPISAAVDRLQEEAARYAAVAAYAANFARMGLKPVETAIAAQTPDAVQRGLAQWQGAVDHIIIRAITAKDTVEEHLALVRAAAPA